jgi:hypothetical protein
MEINSVYVPGTSGGRAMGSPDPNRYWDGQRWLQWDGRQWRAETAAVTAFEQSTTGYPEPYSPQYQPAYGYGQNGLTSDKTGQNIQAIIAWVLTLLTVGYMLPWAIAATRGKSNAGAIGVLNFFVGWTVIGWIAALVMACSAHQLGAGAVNVAVVQGVNYPGGYPQYQPTAQPSYPTPHGPDLAAQPAPPNAPFPPPQQYP